MKDLITMFNNAINNNLVTLERYWHEYIPTAGIDELFEMLKEIESNLPCYHSYIVDSMLVDRERNSTLMCSTFIEDMLEFDEVKKPSELCEDFLKDAIDVIKSGYGSCKIDW